MQVTHIKIQNILGIKELEIKPGSLTEITGRNASGKTSVLEAVKAVFRGGKDATLLRQGEKSGSIVLLLDDGTEITKSVSEDSSTVTVTKGGMKTSSPQGFINQLTDALSVNPVEFLAAPKKHRTQILLEQLPLEIDHQALSNAVPGFKINPTDEHPLILLERVHKTIYDERTGVNRAAKEKDGSIKQLQESLPADAVDVNALKERADELAVEINDIRTEAETDIEEIRIESEEAIAAVSKQIEELVQKREDLRQDAQNRSHKVKQDASEKAHEFDVELSKVRERIDAAALHENTRGYIEQQTAERDDLQKESKGLTAALGGLSDYKQTLLASLPIKGLEIREGDIYLNDVPFDRVNASEQVKVAIQIARLRSHDLGLMCVDGLELLDSAHYQAFVDQAKDGDIQMIITRVSDSELQVKAA